MLGRSSKFACLCVGVWAAVACSGNTGPAGPKLSGNWHGYVSLHDEYGVNLTDNSGITVTALPTTTNSTSSTAGLYTLNNLMTGVYTLSYSGTGYGTFLRPQVAFVGGGDQLIGTTTLGKGSTATIVNLAVATAPDHLTITGTVSAPPTGLQRTIRLFYGSANTVTAVPPGYLLSTSFRSSVAVFTLRVSGLDLQNIRSIVASGSTAYVVAYGDGFDANSYTDSTTGQVIYPNVSSTASNVVSFTVP